MAMRKIVIILLLLLNYACAKGQMHDANWVISTGLNGTNTLLHFTQGSTVPSAVSTNSTIPVIITNASISDAQGNLLFFTNGIHVYDRNFQIIPGCIISTPYSAQLVTTGLDMWNSFVFLPYPNDSNKYLLFYVTPEQIFVNLPQCTNGAWSATHVYYTVLDKTLNGGNGGVVIANQVAVADTFAKFSGLGVTKHANGRDWWILIKEACNDSYKRILFGDTGIKLVASQSIGPVFNNLGYVAIPRFAPDGSIFSLVSNGAMMTLYNFDRCTGLLSSPIFLTDTNFLQEFSPNSLVLYRASLPSGSKTSQYDLSLYNQPGAVQNSLRFVDTDLMDTASCSGPGSIMGSAGAAQSPALAPNGKIYWGHTGGKCNLSVINYPDSLDTLCQMEMNTVLLPNPHNGALPYFPNYRLGPLPGSGCDSLTSVHELQAQDISLYPNPASDRVQISASRALNGALITLFNVQGQQLLQQTPGFGTTFEVQLPGSIKSGIYFIRIQSNEGVVTKKVVLRR